MLTSTVMKRDDEQVLRNTSFGGLHEALWTTTDDGNRSSGLRKKHAQLPFHDHFRPQ